MKLAQLTYEYGHQVFIAFDQLVNALIPPLTGTISWADETLSARSYRAYRDGKFWGRLTMPVINVLFFWQDEHCKKAYQHELYRVGMPAEYREKKAKATGEVA